MVSLIAVGISKYINVDIQDLPYVKLDIERIYDAFSVSLEEQFSSKYSCCYYNLMVNDYKSILQSISYCACAKDDYYILYFSGHADLEGGEELYLLFSDEQGNRFGSLSIRELKSILVRMDVNFIVVLDCCYSGAGTYIANKDKVGICSNISIMSSGEFYKRSYCTEDGSIFTKILSDAIIHMFENDQDISLVSICNMVNNNNNSKCIINIAEGSEDVILKKADKAVDKYPNIVQRFLEKASFSSAVTREMMWYSLFGFKSSIIYDVVEKYLITNNNAEGSWLVRRAIGTVIGKVNGSDKQKNKIICLLLDDHNWMTQSIGIVAARYNMQDLFSERIKKIIQNKSNPMSLVWLANLYFSDSSYRDLMVSKDSNMLTTTWGLISIYTMYRRYYESEEIFDILSKSCNTQTPVFEGFVLHLAFLGERSKLVSNKRFLELASSGLVEKLYRQESRVISTNKRNKWLLSLMYGNWRGYISANLDTYFLNSKHDIIVQDISVSKDIPSVEILTGLLNYIRNNGYNFSQYKKYMLWGLSHPHPWVRRESVNLFREQPEYVLMALNDKIDGLHYLGIFDLLLNISTILPNYNFDTYLSKYEFSINEKAAIEKILLYH